MSRTIDALIAEHVFGINVWRCNYSEEKTDWGIYRDHCYETFKTKEEAERFARDNPRKKQQPTWYNPDVQMDPTLRLYSTSIADAWLVVEKMRDKYYFCLDSEGLSGFFAHFIPQNDNNIIPKVDYDKSAPTAICLAALNALGVKYG